MLPTTIHVTQSRFKEPTIEAKELKVELEKRGVKAYLEL